LTYGWDNEFGIKKFDVEVFKASSMLVSNGEYLEFVQDGGYNKLSFWTEEGRRWLASVKVQKPVFWVLHEDTFKLRTLSKEINMPWDWPVEVNNLEARAFCNWKSEKTGKYIRLPTEAEYYSMRRQLKQDHTDWLYQSVGNINMEYWMSPNPVNLFKNG
jgi:formylglycine-generating enzyme required for sulfatase activity